MSMAWMPMPGHTWFDAAASFLGMWIVMMVAMMLPSLLPMLRRYRRGLSDSGQRRLASLTVLVGMAYFSVWTVFGMAAFALGATLTTLEMSLPQLARAVPMATGAMVLIMGALQFTAWKAHHLACCRKVSGCGRADPGGAWRHGLRLGVHCCHCCAGLTAILIGVGVMSLSAMAIVAVAITVERLAPAGQRAARIIGGIVIAAGLSLIVRAAAALG